MSQFYSIFSKKSIVIALVFAVLSSHAGYVFAKEPTDPRYSVQRDFFTQIGAPAAWDVTTGSTDVVVAVIDTGVDINNPDLKNNIWKNVREIPANGQDDDKNGFVDDVYGWNFVENNNDSSISIINGVDDPGAINHGTLLAGLIGAQGQNDILGTGLNWNVRIMPLRAINNSGSGDLVNVAKAVNYAVNNGASVLSVSFVGFTTDPDLNAALYRAYQKGVVVVAAAGNSRNDSTGSENLTKVKQYPICLDHDYVQNWIVGVTSVDASDGLSFFADYGSCVDISAPGERIFSTQKIASEQGFVKDFDGGWYGTSFSVPLVAGAAALVKSIRPEWKAPEIIDTLLRSADDVDGVNPGFAGQMGYGRLNVGRAVQMARDKQSSVVRLAPSYTVKIIKKQSVYNAEVRTDGKVSVVIPLSGYKASFSKWAIANGMFVHVVQRGNDISVDVWGMSGENKLRNFKLNGFSNLLGVEIVQLWGDNDNVVLFVRKGKIEQKIIIDVPSRSWKIE